LKDDGGHHGRDRIVVGFTTTYAVSVHHHLSCEIKSRSCTLCDLRQVD